MSLITKTRDFILGALNKSPVNKKKTVQASSFPVSYTYRDYWHGYTSNLDELYKSLGYPSKISYNDCRKRYERQEIANRVISAPVKGTWKDEPRIYDETKAEGDSLFERDLSKLIMDVKLYDFLYQVDLLAALGQYAVLYIGLNDGKDPSIPATNARGVAFLSAISEPRATIQTFEEDVKNPRYGLPLTYTITISSDSHVTANLSGTDLTSRLVHHSRTLHVAENKLDSEVYGIPYMQPIFNRLIGLDKLAGASPEMYWLGARPGYTAYSDEAIPMSDAEIEAFQTEMNNFSSNIRRWIYLNRGIKIDSLAPQVVTPYEHIKAQVQLISSYTRIPTRILVGSERGELASGQDERSWLSFLEERRHQVGEKLLLRPFIDKMIELRVISPPKNGEYFIDWDPLIVISEKEQAEIDKIKTETMAIYLNTPAYSSLIPPDKFMINNLGYDEEKVTEMLERNEETLMQEDKEMNNEERESDNTEPDQQSDRETSDGDKQGV